MKQSTILNTRTLSEVNMIAVNEIFGPTIQGEGKSSGKPVMFLRLSGCNLACSWCDTPYTWNWNNTSFVHPEKYDQKDEVHKMEVKDILFNLRKNGEGVRALVISGGEPMLQQAQLYPLLQDLKRDGWWIEVESNGTIFPHPDFLEIVDQINCSPKLSNSGVDNPLKKRILPEVLRAYSSSEKVNFKFVVSRYEDIKEITMLVNDYGMKDVYVMPEGRTIEALKEREGMAKAFCSIIDATFSPRLHIIQFGDKRGV